MGVARHAQITQNNKFAISLQYLEKEVSDESFLWIHTVIFDGDGQAFTKFLKSNFAMSLQHLKKEARDGVQFLPADKHESFNKLVLPFLMEIGQTCPKYPK